VFENRVLKIIFEPKREEVAGEWRRLNNESLHNLYTSPDIIKVIKSRRTSWEGHVARMRQMRNAYKTLVGKPEGKRQLVDERIVLEWILGKQSGKMVDRMHLVQVAGSCEHGTETLVSIKGGNFLPNCVTISFSRTLIHLAS
jgi:hypothetical protein